MSRIVCTRCQHFYITWDRNHPNGCRYFGFKTSQSPAQVVWQSSGEDCKAFVAKPTRAPSG